MADLERFVPSPESQEALVLDINARLLAFPAKYGPCPAFGSQARSYSDGRFTIVYDTDGKEAWVRHI